MKSAICKQIKPIVTKAIEIYNGESMKEMRAKLLEEYKKSPTAKHTIEEWNELKCSLIVSCVLKYIQTNEEEKEQLMKAIYEELREEKC